jgi:hypothetical protein|tara:strand:- start:660 stop:836 length:177 start_codon:yes stop_codon:yes gene_type:complete
MGYKILDVKADIHEEVESYMEQKARQMTQQAMAQQMTTHIIKDDILDIVDKHFEKIER